jgi:uncharacterized protein (TIGR00369 family)
MEPSGSNTIGSDVQPTGNASPDAVDAAPRTRTFSWEDPALTATAGRNQPGIELIRAIMEGSLPAPPIARLLNMTIVEVDEGRAVFALEPAEWMYNPIGSVHGGIAATILDSCMGCAVHTTLPPGVGYTTTDLHVRYVRGMSVGTGRVLAEGTVLHAGGRIATAEARLVVEATGKLMAHATTSCIILR